MLEDIIRGLRAEFYPGIRSRIQNLACLLACLLGWLLAWLVACLSVRQFNVHVLCPFSLYVVFFCFLSCEVTGKLLESKACSFVLPRYPSTDDMGSVHFQCTIKYT